MTTGLGNFTHINESFDCEYCHKAVPAADSGCRNHCPHCLSSKHVDINPGDRASLCLGQLKAFGYELDRKKGIILHFRCQRCGQESRNKADRHSATPDNYDVILSLRA